jgi:hypothetical protein
VTHKAEAEAAPGNQEKPISNLKLEIGNFELGKKTKSRPREPNRGADSAQDAGATRERENEVVMSGENRQV